MKVAIIAGARPNFIKISPILTEIKKHKNLQPILINTGQHYDFEMSKIFFDNLEIINPHYNLEVGSGSNGQQTGRALISIEEVLIKEKPDLVIVVGDVNSTLAGSLAAVKLHIPVAHVEAGLRSCDQRMPEEINRILTDHIATYLFTSEPSAALNLKNEGILSSKIFFVGNVMIDSLINNKKKIDKSPVLKKLSLQEKKYIVLTLHRQENVDDKAIFGQILSAIKEISDSYKIVWPMHPRTKNKIKEFNFDKFLEKIDIIEPLGYIDMIALIKNAKAVLTDSGGIQEETTFLKIPCLTLRNSTERPITEQIGTNKVIGINKKDIFREVKILSNKNFIVKGKIPKFWDGKASERIVKKIVTISKK